MLVSFKDLLLDSSNKELAIDWLMSEIIRSLPDNIIEQAQIRQEFNVQLLIDNIVVEPQLLGNIFVSLEQFIKDQGEFLVKQKLIDLEKRFDQLFLPLEEATKEATQKIRQEFNITDDE